MRHLRSGSKLGKQPAHRRAVLRNLVTNLIEKERIHTTILRAKAARPIAEKMITLGKRDSLHARRQASAFLMTPGATQKLFTDLAPRFAERHGGYTRIIRTGWRIGDGAELAILEFIGSELKKKDKKPRKRAEENAPEEKVEKEAVAAQYGAAFGRFPRRIPESRAQPRDSSFSAARDPTRRFRRSRPCRMNSSRPTINCALAPPLVSMSTSRTAAVRPGTKRW
jgi:large subunit ribosomal protein L17